jgi:hypoxanthine phosphoribosyltransferase
MLRQFNGKEFRKFMPAEEIQKRIKQLGAELSEDFHDKNPVFLGILNGCFMFAGDLFKYLEMDCTITFVKLASYKGTSSTGNVVTAIGLEESLHDKDIIIIEDIVDTGNTMVAFLETLKKKDPKSISICTLFSKPEVHKNKLALDYVGFEIPDKFILGYGLDYDGLGRNLPDLYKIVTEEEDTYRFRDDD